MIKKSSFQKEYYKKIIHDFFVSDIIIQYDCDAEKLGLNIAKNEIHWNIVNQDTKNKIYNKMVEL